MTSQPNFMFTDLWMGAASVLAFPVVLLFPGYLLGWYSNLFSFRQRRLEEKACLGVVLSLGITPILAVTLARYSSLWAAACVFAVTGVVSLGLILRDWTAEWRNSRPRLDGGMEELSKGTLGTTWMVLGMVVIGTVLALLEVADLQLGSRLYTSVAAFDYCIRVPMVQAVLRHGVPPRNPSYLVGGQIPPLRYYYYWYVLCAVPAKLFSLTARAAFCASVVWSGFALAAMVPVYLKHFFHEDKVRRKTLFTLFLIAVCGLDVIPYGLCLLRNPIVILPDINWWNPNQVTPWLASVLWVPHHLAAMLSCMVGLLVLSNSAGATPKLRLVAAGTAGLAFASAAGLSVYVTFTFLVFVIGWVLFLAAEKQFAQVAGYFAAGAVSIVFSLPLLRELLGPGAGGEFVTFALRNLPMWTNWLRLNGVHNEKEILLLSVAAIPLVYALQFGVFFLFGVERAKSELLAKPPMPMNSRAAWGVLLSSLLVATFLRSGVIESNDLGMRSTLLALFVLLLWSGPRLSDLFERKSTRPSGSAHHVVRGISVALILVGLCSSVLELCLLRGYAPWVDSHSNPRMDDFLPASPGMGNRTMSLRKTYEALNRQFPENAVFQHNPRAAAFVPILLYTGHQAVAATGSCGAEFGGDPGGCKPVAEVLTSLYNVQGAYGYWNVDGLCRELGIDVLVVTDADPVWPDPGSWVWRHKALISDPYTRAIPCGAGSLPAAGDY